MGRRGSRQVASSYDRSSGSGNRYVIVGPFAAPGVVVGVRWLFTYDNSVPLTPTYDVGFVLTRSNEASLENFLGSTGLVQRVRSGLLGSSFVGMMRFRNAPGAGSELLETWVEYQSGPVFVLASWRPSVSVFTDFLVTVMVKRDVFDPVPVVSAIEEVRGDDSA